MFSVRNPRGRIMAAICSFTLAVSGLLAGSLAASATTTPVPPIIPGVIGTAFGVMPLTSTGCNGDVCIYLTNPSPGVLLIEVWAYDANFYGHFQITGADTDADGNTDTQEWYGGGANGSVWAYESPSGNGQ